MLTTWIALKYYMLNKDFSSGDRNYIYENQQKSFLTIFGTKDRKWQLTKMQTQWPTQKMIIL